MKKFLAVLLTLVMALSICVPAFAADEGTTKPSDTQQDQSNSKGGVDNILDLLGGLDVKALVENFVKDQIDSKINSTFIVLNDYVKKHKLPSENYDEWVRNFIVGEAISVKAAKVAVTNMYNQGTFTAAEIRYAQEALRKDILTYQPQLKKSQANFDTKNQAIENEKKELEPYLDKQKELIEKYGSNYHSVLDEKIKDLDIQIRKARNQPELKKKLEADKELLIKEKEIYSYIQTEQTLIAQLEGDKESYEKEINSTNALILERQSLSDKMTETYHLTTAEKALLKTDIEKYLPTMGTTAAPYYKAILNILDYQDKISDAQYQGVMEALTNFKKADLPPVIKTDVDENVYKLVCEAKDGKAVTDALTGLGLPIKLMPQAIDKLVGKKIILESIGKLGKESVTELLKPNANKGDTSEQKDPEKEESASGIKGFINSLLDKFKGGKDDANKGEVDNTENGNTPATGDVAIYSVLGLAAVAGVAVVLTKKKKNVK